MSGYIGVSFFFVFRSLFFEVESVKGVFYLFFGEAFGVYIDIVEDVLGKGEDRGFGKGLRWKCWNYLTVGF